MKVLTARSVDTSERVRVLGEVKQSVMKVLLGREQRGETSMALWQQGQTAFMKISF